MSNISPRLDVRAALDSLYHASVIRNGGDVEIAKREVAAIQPEVQRLSELTERVRGGDVQALKEARGILQKHQIPEDIIYPWLQAHVDVSTIKKAGIDPEEVKRKFTEFEGKQRKLEAKAAEGPSQKAGSMDEYPKRA